MDEDIADRVKKRMKLLGYKQVPLASKCGVKQSAISKLIRRKTETPDFIYELSRALETNIRWLKTGLGNPDYIEGGQSEAVTAPAPATAPAPPIEQGRAIPHDAFAILKAYTESGHEQQQLFDTMYAALKHNKSDAKKNESK